jgi:pimeloyl-ACP methyl ester carboxylesterase
LLRRMASRSATERNLRSAVGPGSTIVEEAMVDRVHALLSRPGNRDAFIDFANTDQLDRTGEIPRITAPTLTLRSGMIDGQHFARDITGSRESTYADGGHLLPEEAPEWVAGAIREVLTADSFGGGQSQKEARP